MKHPRKAGGAIAAMAAMTMAILISGCSQDAPTGEDMSEGGLAEGGAAPNFTLPSAQGASVSLASFRGEKAALLYFSMGPG